MSSVIKHSLEMFCSREGAEEEPLNPLNISLCHPGIMQRYQMYVYGFLLHSGKAHFLSPQKRLSGSNTIFCLILAITRGLILLPVVVTNKPQLSSSLLLFLGFNKRSFVMASFSSYYRSPNFLSRGTGPYAPVTQHCKPDLSACTWFLTLCFYSQWLNLSVISCMNR